MARIIDIICSQMFKIAYLKATYFRSALIPLFCILVIALQLIMGCVKKVQRVDPNFRSSLRNPPTYRRGDGPVVWIDEAHHNIVATKGRYEPFVEVLLRDGYVVKAFQSTFTAESLIDIGLLVIGNARHPRTVFNEDLPTPSAFTTDEIEAVYNWVSEGGALLLLSDHMPFAGAASDLGKKFGFEFNNGYVVDPNLWDPTVFNLDDGTLVDHMITRGLSETEIVKSVGTYIGQAFRAVDADPLMVLGPNYVSYTPEKAWDIKEESPYIEVTGWLQGAVKHVGEGRIAVFGDATMFSAQLSSEDMPIGMNSPESKENIQFLLNVLHWLTGKLDS